MSSASRTGPTVIVPSGNSGTDIVATVQSALMAGDASDLDVLVVDDGSPGHTVTELAELRDPRLRVVCQPPRGLADTLNLALALAETRWVSVLLPGDRLLSQWAECTARVAQAAPDVKAVFPVGGLSEAARGEVGDELGCGDPRSEPDPDVLARPDLLLGLVERNTLPFSGTLFDRFAALRAGGFDPMLRVALDHDLWLRLLPGGHAGLVRRPLIVGEACRSHAFDPSDVEAERAYAVAKALASLRPCDWRPGLGEFPSSDDQAMLALELARRLTRSGIGALLGHAATLAGRAVANGQMIPDDEDFAPLLRHHPGLRREGPRSGASAVDVPLSSPPASSAGRDVLRVAFEVEALDRGGLESVVARLALGLRSRAVLPLVVCTRSGGRQAEELRAAGVEVIVLEGPDADRERRYERLLVERRIDLLNAHFSNRGVPIAARQGIPALVTLHNSYAWLGSSPLDDFRRIDRDVAGYVAVSQSVADFTVRRFAIDASRIAVIRNGTELRPAEDRDAARSSLGIAQDRILLVQVGRIDPIKSQLALVAAMRALAPERPELLAWIVGGIGNASYALRVRHGIMAAGLGETIALKGERDDVARILAAADVMVMPSVLEGFSLAAVEAMSAGLPVVLSRTGDAAWLLGERQDGSGSVPGALVDGPCFAPHVDGDLLNREAELDEPEHSHRLVAAIASVLDDLPRMRDLARVRGAELAPLVSLDRQLDAHAGLFTAVAASGGARGVRALHLAARTEAERTSEVAEQARSLATAVWPLADLLLEGADLGHRAASIERSLAASEADAESALDRTTKALEKLRIMRRVRAALRQLRPRTPGRPTT